MKNMFFLFTALLGMTVSNAAAANEEGFYVGILGGANWADQSTRHHVKVDYKAGYLVGASVGYAWCDNWSVEGEFTYRHNKIDHVKFRNHDKDHSTSFAHSSSSDEHKKHHNNANLRSYAIMANVRYDFAIDCCFTPYIRAGLGYANSEYKLNRDHDHNYASNNGNCGKHSKRHCSENGFAYQAGLGFSMPVGCNTALDIGYNFLGAEKELYNHSVVFAARYTF